MNNMQSGMMWFDDDKNRSIEEKIGNAIDYYHQKYGIVPTQCCVSAKSIQEEFLVNEVSVKPRKFIRPQHFWIGRVN